MEPIAQELLPGARSKWLEPLQKQTNTINGKVNHSQIEHDENSTESADRPEA